MDVNTVSGQPMDEAINSRGSFLAHLQGHDYHTHPLILFASSCLLPFILTLVWLMIPINNHGLFTFCFLMYPLFVAMYSWHVWSTTSVYLPLPSVKVQAATTGVSIIIVLFMQMIYFFGLSNTILLRGAITTFIVALGSAMGVTFYYTNRLVEEGELQAKSAYVNKEDEPLLNKDSGSSVSCYSCKQFLHNAMDSGAVTPLFPSLPTILRKEFLSIALPVTITFAYAEWLTLFHVVIWEELSAPEIQVTLILLFNLSGVIFRKMIQVSIEKLESTPNFELPKNIIFTFTFEFIYSSFYRKLLWSCHGAVFPVFLFSLIAEDLYRGVFQLFSHKLPDNTFLNFFKTDYNLEQQEVSMLHYILRKQAHFVSDITIFVGTILLYYYWNSGFFGPELKEHTNFTGAMYLIPISAAFDLMGHIVTWISIRKFLETEISLLDLLKKFYSYPRIFICIITASLASLQLVFIGSLEVKEFVRL